MKTKEEIKMFNSLLNEKCIFNERLKKVYELILSEDYDEALFELEGMNRRYPYMVDIYHLRFKIYCIKDKYSLAEKVLTEAENLFDGNEKISEDRAYLTKMQNMLNNEYLKNKEYDVLAEKTDKEIAAGKAGSTSASSYYYRALSYRMLNNENSNAYYKEACKVYDNLSSRKEKDFSIYLYKALCHKDMKEYGEALKIVNSILQKDYENKEALKIKISIIKELKNNKI